MEVHVDRVSPAGDEVLVLLLVHLDAQRGGLLLDGPIYETVRVEDGKISRIRLFLDKQNAFEAAGLSE
jgi:ketosteroid isomerase-like protein